MGVVLLSALPFSLRVNISESLPTGLYLLEANRLPQRGELTIARLSESDIADKVVRDLVKRRPPLLKPVGAVAGDFLTTTETRIYRCPHSRLPDTQCVVLGTGQRFDSLGRTLPTAQFQQTKIPQGMVYLGDMRVHPKSLDSRYFGLVPIEKMQGVAHPLLTL